MVALLIKKIISVIILLFSFSFTVFSAHEGSISAYSAVVINADTKEILYEKNAYAKRSMASTTKIMTSILAIESGKLHHEIKATKDILTEGSSIGLKDGYRLTLESLVYGMMLESGNDAANLTAVYLGGSYEAFSEMMNQKASEIGMLNTNFVTPSGLDAENHYTTAYDMALLGAYCIKNPMFRYICSAESKSVTLIDPEIILNFKNHNKLLNSCDGVFGIKTGFTKKSGRCLVTACEREGATLVCVTLNASDDWNDHIRLYDWCYSDLSRKTIDAIEFDCVKIYGSEKKYLEVFCDDFVLYSKEISADINSEVYINKIIYAPVKENDILGKVVFTSEGNCIGTVNIYAASSAALCESTYKENFSLIRFIKKIFSE